MFSVQLEIVKKPIRIWDLKPGERFCLNPTGWNAHTQQFEIYVKRSRSKALLDSSPEKTEVSIVKIAPRDVGYKIVEFWSQLPT